MEIKDAEILVLYLVHCLPFIPVRQKVDIEFSSPPVSEDHGIYVINHLIEHYPVSHSRLLSCKENLDNSLDDLYSHFYL